jgi:hypothetical protein
MQIGNNRAGRQTSIKRSGGRAERKVQRCLRCDTRMATVARFSSLLKFRHEELRDACEGRQ